jgi:hypothetical protein
MKSAGHAALLPSAAKILPSGQAVSPHQQIIGRWYLVALVIVIYLFVAPVWLASNLYQVCSRILASSR